MGAINDEMPRTIWVNVRTIERTDADGSVTKVGCIETSDQGVKTKHKGFRAHLVGYKYRTQEEGARFGLELHLIFRDGTQVYDMGMLIVSGYARSFMATVENCDLRKPITIYPFYKEEEEKKVGWLNLFQDDKPVPRKYSTKDPGPMPPKEMLDLDGSGVLKPNFKQQVAFLRAILEGPIHKELEKIAAESLIGEPGDPQGAAVDSPAPATVSVNDPVPPASHNEPPPIGGDDDDLPF